MAQCKPALYKEAVSPSFDPKKLKRRQAVTFWYLIDPVFTCFLTSLGARCVWRPSETGQCPARCWAAILHPDQGQRAKAWWLHHWILDRHLQSQITSDCRQSGGCVRIFRNVLSAQLWRVWVCNWMQLMQMNVSFVNWCNGDSDRPLAFLVVAKGARRNLRQGGQAVYAKAACLLGGPIQHRYGTRIGRASWGHFKLALWQLPKLS